MNSEPGVSRILPQCQRGLAPCSWVDRGSHCCLHVSPGRDLSSGAGRLRRTLAGEEEKPRERLSLVSRASIAGGPSKQTTPMAVTSRRAISKKPAKSSNWSRQETLDLIKVWGGPSILSGLQNRQRKAATERKIARFMKQNGHSRTLQQCCTKMRDMKYTYRKARQANTQPGASLQRFPYYDQLHVILGRNLTSFPRQTTQEIPSRRVENSLALGQEEQAISTFQDSTDPGEGPSVRPAGSLQSTPPARTAVQHPQIHRQKRTREDVLKEQMEKSNTFLERIAERQEGIEECLERVVERQERFKECVERIATRQEGIGECLERAVERQERFMECVERIVARQNPLYTQEGIAERQERVMKRQERVVEHQERIPSVVSILTRNASGPRQNTCRSSPSPVASRTRGENSRVPSHVTSRASQGKRPSSHF